MNAPRKATLFEQELPFSAPNKQILAQHRYGYALLGFVVFAQKSSPLAPNKRP
jgi:hypothetical protein